jgi:hypothetical protein
MSDLEQRIATALTADDIISSDLSQLIAKTDAAITAADETAEEERARALDPALSPDPKAARQAMEDALFSAGRLKTLLPRLQKRYEDLRAKEYAAAWSTDFKRVEALLNEAAEAFERDYPAAVEQIVALMRRISTVNAEVSYINGHAPPGNYPRLHTVERKVRGHLEQPDVNIAEQLRLPHLHRNRGPVYAWPPPEQNPGVQLARAMMANPDMYAVDTMNWHEQIDRRNARLIEDNRRQVEQAEQRMREREQREAAELEKAKQADREAYAERGWPV